MQKARARCVSSQGQVCKSILVCSFDIDSVQLTEKR